MSQDLQLGLRDRIEKVLVSGGERTPAQRAGIETRLSSSSLRPAGMAPSAILLIDELADPLPGRLASGNGLRCDPGWQQALEQRLTTLYQRASRPQAGELPTNAQSILFRDRGELVACWTVARVRGLTSAWWWRLLRLPGGAVGASEVFAALSPDPRCLPAAAARLADWGALVEIATALRSGEATQLERALRQVYRLSPLPESSTGLPLATSQRIPTPPERLRSGPRTVPAPLPVTTRPSPWSPWLSGPACVHLDGEQEALFGLALLLFHAPERARSPEFESQRSERLSTRLPPRPLPAAGGEPPTPSLTRRSRPDSVDTIPGPHDAPPRGDATERDPVAGAGDAPASAVSENELDERSSGTPSKSRGRGDPTAPAKEAPREASLGAHDTDSTTAPEQPEPTSTTTRLEARLPTDFGGVLYLIHLISDLDLPAVFEPDWSLASTVGGWGTLDLVARGLLSSSAWRDDCPESATSRSERVWDDPVWAVLADLDQRRVDQAPGAGFRCDSQFVAPTSWGPRPARPDFPSAAPILGPRHQAPLTHDLSRWLRGALPWLEHRMSQAFDSSPDKAPTPPDAVALFAARGWLTASATHVDLVMPLDGAQIAVRRAGLDRSPGWVPHLGRIVSFHFE